MHAFDRRTDRRTDSFILTRPPCIQCSAINIDKFTAMVRVAAFFDSQCSLLIMGDLRKCLYSCTVSCASRPRGCLSRHHIKRYSLGNWIDQSSRRFTLAECFLIMTTSMRSSSMMNKACRWIVCVSATYVYYAVWVEGRSACTLSMLMQRWWLMFRPGHRFGQRRSTAE